MDEHDRAILDAVEKFHRLYSDAMARITWLIGLAFVVIGIAMPILIQYTQWKSFKSESDSIKADIQQNQAVVLRTSIDDFTKEVNKALATLQAQQREVQAKTNTCITDFNKEVNRCLAILEARQDQISAIADLNFHSYGAAANGLTKATSRYCDAITDQPEIETCLSVLATNVLPALKKQDVSDSLETSMQTMLKRVAERYPDGRYTSALDLVRENLKKAKERT